MTPQEKAKELIEKFGSKPGIRGYDSIEGRRLALICVEEILSLRMINNMGRESNDPLSLSEGQYWQSVKASITEIKR